MTRKQALNVIKAAGATNDQKTFLRVYVENRISFPVARQAFEQGKRLGEWIKARDAEGVFLEPSS